MSIKAIFISLLIFYYVSDTLAKKDGKSKQKKSKNNGKNKNKTGKGKKKDKSSVKEQYHSSVNCMGYEKDLEGCLSLSKLLFLKFS